MVAVAHSGAAFLSVLLAPLRDVVTKENSSSYYLAEKGKHGNGVCQIMAIECHAAAVHYMHLVGSKSFHTVLRSG